ncbi:hypothetical protein GCM10023144_05820 [Pigmentiphaga soli]|uniref:MatE family transporter n=1 Tax=Pigmentiphaga soli TaxID=1007095 RepID=A0ABP8GHF6_9BURK
MKNVPDTNAAAPRPRHMSDQEERRPDMDHPPRAGDTETLFDRGTAAEEQEARTGTLPGAEDFTRMRPDGRGAGAPGGDRDDPADPDRTAGFTEDGNAPGMREGRPGK